MKKIGIITGASSGMGREFVRQLDKCLCYVDELWIIARRKDRLELLKQEAAHIPLRIIPLDLCNKEDLNRFSGQLKQEQPRVRILVNCAGVGYAGYFHELSQRDIQNMISLNIMALTTINSIVLPYMNHPSHIIQLASASAFLPQKEFSVYAATKAYVLSFSMALKRELKNRGVAVTTVCPGPVDTEFLKICNRGKGQKLLKKLTTVKPEAVVHKALKDAKKGKALSIYGLPMKGVYILSHFDFRQ